MYQPLFILLSSFFLFSFSFPRKLIFILIRARGAKWNTPNYLHRLLLSQFMKNGWAVTLRPLFSHSLKLENKSARKRQATESWLLSLPPHAGCCNRIANGRKVACMAVSSNLGLFIPLNHEKKNALCQNRSSVKVWCSTTIWACTWLISWLSQCLILLAAGAQHFTYSSRFSSCGGCSILTSSPGGPLGPVQEGTSKLQPQGQAVKTCSSCVCECCSTWWCKAVLSLS